MHPSLPCGLFWDPMVQQGAELDREELSDTDWRFSLQNAAEAGYKNCLSLVEASVDPDFRGLGLARQLLEKAKHEARRQAFRAVIAPVRPGMNADFTTCPGLT